MSRYNSNLVRIIDQRTADDLDLNITPGSALGCTVHFVEDSQGMPPVFSSGKRIICESQPESKPAHGPKLQEPSHELSPCR